MARCIARRRGARSPCLSRSLSAVGAGLGFGRRRLGLVPHVSAHAGRSRDRPPPTNNCDWAHFDRCVCAAWGRRSCADDLVGSGRLCTGRQARNVLYRSRRRCCGDCGVEPGRCGTPVSRKGSLRAAALAVVEVTATCLCLRARDPSRLQLGAAAPVGSVCRCPTSDVILQAWRSRYLWLNGGYG